MSFSSNIFTNLPLVYTLNPDFLGQQLWLCFSAGSWMSSRETPEQSPRQIPELAFTSSPVRECLHTKLPNRVLDRFPNCTSSEVRAPPAWGSGPPHVRDPITPPNQDSWTSYIREFGASKNREFPGPEKYVSRTLSNLSFRGWRVFLNSPTLAPRGSGLTPTIWFHESFGNLVKNVTLGMSEGTRVAREP
jgi:hypothetical protein